MNSNRHEITKLKTRYVKTSRTWYDKILKPNWYLKSLSTSFYVLNFVRLNNFFIIIIVFSIPIICDLINGTMLGKLPGTRNEKNEMIFNFNNIKKIFITSFFYFTNFYDFNIIIMKKWKKARIPQNDEIWRN